MADKSLKISVKSDLREGRKLAEFIADLQKRVDKFAKTLGNINIGGAGPGGQTKPGQQGLLKQLTEDKRAMEAMGRETDALQRRYRHLGDEFNILTARLQLAEKHMQRFQAAAGGRGGAGGTSPGGMPSWFQTPGGPMPAWFQNPTGGGPGGVAPPGGGPPGAPPGGGINWNQPVGGALGQLARFVGWGAIVKNLVEGFVGAPQRQIDWTMQGARSGAEGAQAMGGFGARMLGGDIGPAMGLMRAMGGGRGNTRFTRDDFSRVVDAGPDMALNQALKMGITSTATLNLVKGWNDTGRALTPQARAARMQELYKSVIETGEQQDPMEDARIGYARSVAPGRVGFARKYGRGFAAGIPLGGSVDPNQTMATVGAVLDVLGTGVNVNKVTRIVTEATRLGLTSESIQTMLRSQEMSGGGGNIVERVLRSGLSRPMMSRAGTAAAGMADQSLLRINPGLFLGGFASGSGIDEKTMRAREAGFGFLNQMSTGGLDQYQATVNMALATKKGRSVFTSGLMGKMTISELMQAASNPTREQTAAGIKREDAEDLLNAEVNSLGNRYFSEKGVEQSPALKRLQEALRSKGGIMGEARRLGGLGKKGENDLMELETGLNMVTGQALGTQSLRALVGAQSGGPAGAKAGETQGTYGTALASTMAGAKEMERDWVKMKFAMDDVRAVVKAFPDTVREFQQAMSQVTPEGVQVSTESLMGLGSAMGDIAKKGPDAVRVMDKVVEFIDALATKKAAIEQAQREQMDFSMVGP